ncbi:MAG: hypothetical protein IV100_18530, partial [Myxococcales bacterium]|nr:hypothetical protein [Myxococcales bacterium]
MQSAASSSPLGALGPDYYVRKRRLSAATRWLLVAVAVVGCGESTSPSEQDTTPLDSTAPLPEPDASESAEDSVGEVMDDVEAPECDEVCQAQAIPDGDDCVGTADYFEHYSWPVVISKCVACHVAGGQAESSRYVLKPKEVPGYL